MKYSRLAAGLALAGSLTILALCGANCRSRELLRDEQIKVASLTLERDGFQKALQAKPKEIIKFVDKLVPTETKAQIRKGVVKPVAAGKLSASQVVDLPLVKPADDSAPSLPREELANESAPPGPVTTPVTFGISADFLITKINAANDVEWEASLDGSVALPEGEPITFPFSEQKIDIRVNEDIVEALTAHELEGGWFKRHTSLTCGGGLGYDFIESRVIPTAACVYGISFF